MSVFVFGHRGKPSLTRTVCTRTPRFSKLPARSWFKDIKDFPYGGWGLQARLYCRTELSLSPVFNYYVKDCMAGDDLGSVFKISTVIPVIPANQTGRMQDASAA